MRKRKGKKISKELWHGHEELRNIGGARQYSLMEKCPRNEPGLGNRSSTEDQKSQTMRWEVLRLLEENQIYNSHAPESHPGLCQEQKEQPAHREDAEATDGRPRFPEDTLGEK